MSITIKKFHKNGVQFDAVEKVRGKFLRPPVLQTVRYNVAKGKGKEDARFDVIDHNRRSYAVFNKGHEYLISVGATEPTIKVNATTDFVVIDITDYGNDVSLGFAE